MARDCVFCGGPLGGPASSKEHIFPRWLQEHLGLKGEEVVSLLYADSGKIARRRTHSLSAHVSGLVCRRCNTDWLADLEAQAKPILIPLVDGSFSGQVRGKDCQIIAFWVFKTALTLQSVSLRERLVPPDHYRGLWEKMAMPAGAGVSIAHCAGNGGLSWIEGQNLLLLPEEEVTEEVEADLTRT
jgi:hypothetical protein